VGVLPQARLVTLLGIRFLSVTIEDAKAPKRLQEYGSSVQAKEAVASSLANVESSMVPKANTSTG